MPSSGEEFPTVGAAQSFRRGSEGRLRAEKETTLVLNPEMNHLIDDVGL